jgi:hypothetical protein
MKTKFLHRAALLLALASPTLAFAQGAVIEIPVADQSRWEYFSDQVMGGISEGGASFGREDDAPVLHLRGDVSTANRGGFIQARAMLEGRLPDTAQGVILNVRGNGETYFVHLRTSRTILPWQFYQASFKATPTWQEVRIPFSDFSPYGRLLRRSFDVGTVRSIAVAAFGKDYTADLSVRFVGVY